MNARSFVAALLALCSTIFAFSGGDGTPENPYQISTQPDLEAVNNNLAASYILINDIDLSGTTYTQAVIAPDQSTDMGFQGTNFSGVFNGNGFAISNLTINSGTNSQHIALLGHVNQLGKIKNLVLRDCNINGGSIVGGIVAYNSGRIDACNSTGTVTGLGSYTGGLAGYNFGNISTSHFNGMVYGVDYTGGLAGRNAGSVYRSYSAGEVDGNNYVGGLIGYNSAIPGISSCYSTAIVMGNNSTGGLAGSNRGIISGCYSTGSTTGNNFVGGLSGDNTLQIQNSYSSSKVVGVSSVGGFVGSNISGSISKCYSTGTAAGSEFVGGLVGAGAGSVSASFWDTQTSGLPVSNGGTGKTTTQMKTLSTFTAVNWRFIGQSGILEDGDWYMPTSGYPKVSCQAISVGTGTKENPYQIGNKTALTLVNKDLTAHYIMVNDIDLAGETYLQPFITRDTNPTYGNYGEPFSGVFDGNGFAIRNLKISGATRNDYIGLFGYIGQTGEVKNLGLVNCNVTGEMRVGGLAGYNLGNISNSYSTGTVNCSGSNTGGLVGYNDSGVISNCYSTATVTGNDQTGGLVGFNSGDISNSYAAAKTTGAAYVGGLIGKSYGNVYSCHSSNSVTGSGSYVGGLVGYNYYHIISDSYSTATVTGYINVGGLVGENYHNGISGCYSTGNVNGYDVVGGLIGSNNKSEVSGSYSSSTVSGEECIGGLVGYNNADISLCYFTGAVISEERSGGLIGVNAGSISNSYSVGTISGISYIGGLVGRNEYGTISNSYSACAISAQERIGGLVAENHSGVITRCFWDIETSNISTSDGGTGFSTAQLQSSDTFCFNYWSQVWTIDNGNDYPHLAWENAVGEPLSDCGVPFAGSGTVKDPYIINSTDDFLKICEGSFYWDKHLILNADVDMDGFVYTRSLIGFNETEYFSGSFDGNGHIIRNLTFYTASFTNSHIGLFGYISESGEVRNLNLQNVSISSYERYIGGLVSYNLGNITNCSAQVTITGFSYNYVGGLIGFNSATGSVNNCSSSGQVSGYINVGGLVGENYGEILGCYSNAAVNGSDSSGSGIKYSNVGGIVGYNRNYISKCYSDGTIRSLDNYADLGGLAGFNSGTISTCYSYGEIARAGRYCGGLVGTNGGNLLNSYSSKSVIGKEYAGGLVGYNYSNISNCYSTGSVKGNNNTTDVGGLVGYNSGSLSNSYFSGPGKAAEANYYFGPLFGNKTNFGNILNCFWDIETTGDSYSVAGDGKTTAQMKTIDTFISSGWDFVNEANNGQMEIWYMPEGDYPKLYWQADAGDMNYDGFVDRFDLDVIISQWLGQALGNQRLTADIDGNGRVDNADLSILANALRQPWADINGDGVINDLDLHLLCDSWLAGGDNLDADINKDSLVDILDYSILAAQWLNGI